jgi:anti-sigma factor RsiW
MTDRTSPWTDAELAAYLSGAAPAAQRLAIDAALADDERLGARLMALDDFPPSVAAAFESLLDVAPAAVLGEGLAVAKARADAPRGSAPIPRRWALGGMAAAVAAAFGTGVLSGRSVLAPSHPETARATPPSASPASPAPWFEAVAAYVSLYSTDTFARNPLSPGDRARSLAFVGDSTGLDLSGLGQIAGLSLQRAELLQLGGKPLGQVAYLDARGRPVAICILLRPVPAGGFPAPAAGPRFKAVQASGLKIVHWDVQPHGFLVIGPQDEDQLRSLALQVAQAI